MSRVMNICMVERCIEGNVVLELQEVGDGN